MKDGRPAEKTRAERLRPGVSRKSGRAWGKVTIARARRRRQRAHPKLRLPRVIRITKLWVRNPMSVLSPRFCTIASMALNPGTVGYEFFSNDHQSLRATTKASQINSSHVVGFGALWLSLGATSWALPGWSGASFRFFRARHRWRAPLEPPPRIEAVTVLHQPVDKTLRPSRARCACVHERCGRRRRTSHEYRNPAAVAERAHPEGH